MTEESDIKNKPEKFDNSLTKELVNHQFPKTGKFLFIAVVLSLIFGFVAGGLGGIFAFQNPYLQKYFKLEPQNQQLNQTVVLSEESAVIDVVGKASPAVVSVIASKDVSKIPQLNPFFPFFETPTQNPKEPNIQQVGAGSGFFVSADGLILTNKHVVADSEAEYTVITNDGKEYQAKVVATDPRNDLAILKIEADKLPFLSLGDSSQVLVGQRVVAIGNSLGQYQNTVTTGVVSGIGRSITAGGGEGFEQLEGVIQTDAAINPGNSGGPLLNTAGQVIGVNTAIDSQGQLVGFAIPANDAAKALESFRKTGSIKRPFIGVRYIMITKALAEKESLPKDYGALLVRGDTATDFAVVPGSPADKAGLIENDIILEVNGKPLKGSATLAGMLKEFDAGATINLKVLSKGEEKLVKVTLGEVK